MNAVSILLEWAALGMGGYLVSALIMFALSYGGYRKVSKPLVLLPPFLVVGLTIWKYLWDPGLDSPIAVLFVRDNPLVYIGAGAGALMGSRVFYGWLEKLPKIADRFTDRGATVGSEEHSAPAAAQPEPATKSCPYCGERILDVAIRCKHCQADLTVKP